VAAVRKLIAFTVKVALIACAPWGYAGTGNAAESGKTPTFTKDVAPILFKNCLRCHGASGIASRYALASYEDAFGRAQVIKEKVSTRQMPPWPADPEKSLKFRNDARLSQAEIDTIVAWVDGGAPKGNDADLPAIEKFQQGLAQVDGRKPDLVIALSGDVHLPATGELPYARQLIQLPFRGDRWVIATETEPTNPAVVHHMALTEVSLPDGMTPSGLEQLAESMRKMGNPAKPVTPTAVVTTPSIPKLTDMLGIYTPGTTLEVYPSGTAKLLRGGENDYLNFNIHYETTGRPEIDRSQIAFWFQPEPPLHQLFRVNGAGEAIIANGRELLTDDPGVKAEGTHVAIPPIPMSAENYELIGMTAYTDPITLYQFQPHAHHHCKDFTYTVVYPDGHELTLLTVPHYDHRWQMAYELEEPLHLPAGSKIVVTAHYENSSMNMGKHASDGMVHFRDQNQSWDEMFTPFVQLSVDREGTDGKHPTEKTSNGPGSLGIVEAVGCLTAEPSGRWSLSQGTEAASSGSEGTTSVALKSAVEQSLGKNRYRLLGAGGFHPADNRGNKVAVKGVLIGNSEGLSINVTSLQKVTSGCAQ
jgi:mono/diheme cytochrome c family protein